MLWVQDIHNKNSFLIMFRIAYHFSQYELVYQELLANEDFAHLTDFLIYNKNFLLSYQHDSRERTWDGISSKNGKNLSLHKALPQRLK
jgi:hypothetical protein